MNKHFKIMIILVILLPGCTNKTSEINNPSIHSSETVISNLPNNTANDLKHYTPAPQISEMPGKRFSDNVIINPKEIKVGDILVGQQVAAINELPKGINMDTKNVFIRFSGQIELEGIYKYHAKNDEFFGDLVTFLPNQASALKIPVILTAQNNIRQPFFTLKLLHDAHRQQFSPQESEGKAKIVISDYQIRYASSEIWDTANLVQIKEINRFNTAFLPDGKLLYPNQEFVEWKDLKVKIINNGSGENKGAALDKLIRSQMSPMDDFNIVQNEKIDLTGQTATLAIIQRKKNPAPYEFFVIATKQHNTMKDLNLIFSLHAEYSGMDIDTAKDQIVQISKTWTLPKNAWFPEN